MAEGITLSAVYAELNDAIRKAGSQKEYAERVGISATFLNDALHGRRDIPGAVLADLGLMRVTRFIRKEGSSHNGG